MVVYYYPFPTKALKLDFCTYCLRQNNPEVAELYRCLSFQAVHRWAVAVRWRLST